MKPGSKVKVRCVNKAHNTWEVDPDGEVEAVVNFVQPDGTIYLVNTARDQDFTLTIAPKHPKKGEDAPDHPNVGNTVAPPAPEEKAEKAGKKS